MNVEDAIKKIIDKDFKPVVLSPTERVDLGSISKHPGMRVLFGHIAKEHCDQQQMAIMNVEPGDPNRVNQLASISATAYAMRLFLALLEQEVNHNWAILERAEMERQKEQVAQ